MKCSNHQSVIVSLNNGKITSIDQPVHRNLEQQTFEIPNNNDLNSSKLTNSSIKRTNSKMANLLDYYPHSNMDGIYLSWDHAVNSKELLDQSIKSSSLLIEADVSLSENNKYHIIPMMCHPPDTTSDLTLDSFLQQIIESKSNKGIKLDFKGTKVVEPSFRILAKYYPNLQDRPIILNADILMGDYNTTQQPVDAWTFLMLSSRFPKAFISIGWCIEVNDQYLRTGYSRKMVDQMLTLLKQFNINGTQTLTFAVNASLMRVSIENLNYLLSQLQNKNNSLTIWSHPNHILSLDDLLHFRTQFSPSQLIYDIPKDLYQQFKAQVVDH